MAARSWNKVELMGNLTRDPELRYTPNGAAVCTFGIATNRSYVVDGERKEDVDFHRLVAWNKLAELCNNLLKKGTRVFVSGRLQYREWETQEGQKRKEAEIVVDDMIVITPKGGAGGDEYTPASSPSRDENPSVEELEVASEPSKPSSSAPTDDVTPEPESAPEEENLPAGRQEKPSSKPDETVNGDDLPF